LRVEASGAGLRCQGSERCPLHGEEAHPRQALRTSIRRQFLKIVIAFGDKCPQNGSKNEPMAQRTCLG
jgi:hypothetical protein